MALLPGWLCIVSAHIVTLADNPAFSNTGEKNLPRQKVEGQIFQPFSLSYKKPHLCVYYCFYEGWISNASKLPASLFHETRAFSLNGELAVLLQDQTKEANGTINVSSESFSLSLWKDTSEGNKFFFFENSQQRTLCNYCCVNKWTTKLFFFIAKPFQLMVHSVFTHSYSHTVVDGRSCLTAECLHFYIPLPHNSKFPLALKQAVCGFLNQSPGENVVQFIALKSLPRKLTSAGQNSGYQVSAGHKILPSIFMESLTRRPFHIRVSPQK